MREGGGISKREKHHISHSIQIKLPPRLSVFLSLNFLKHKNKVKRLPVHYFERKSSLKSKEKD